MRRTTVVAAASLIVYLCLSNWLFPSHSMAFRDNSAMSLQSSSRDVKNGTILSHVPLSCQRVCSSRPNRIVLDTAGFGKHGLGSRMSIFRAMGNLAGYFCANLLVAPPKVMVSYLSWDRWTNSTIAADTHYVWSVWVITSYPRSIIEAKNFQQI